MSGNIDTLGAFTKGSSYSFVCVCVLIRKIQSSEREGEREGQFILSQKMQQRICGCIQDSEMLIYALS